MSEEESRERVLTLSIGDIERASIHYDEASDTLYIEFSGGEPDEVILTESNIIVRIREGRVVGIAIPDIMKRIRGEQS